MGCEVIVKCKCLYSCNSCNSKLRIKDLKMGLRGDSQMQMSELLQLLNSCNY